MHKGSEGPVAAGREARQIIAAVSACFFFSGTTGLIYEVLWTRMLGLVFGHTVFAITTVLAAFMAGLGLGSYLFGRLADRQDHPLRLYGLLEMGIGLYALLTPILFSKAEAIYIRLHQSLQLSFFAFSLSQFILIFCILLVPTTLMGATLPVMSRFFVREMESLGSQVGWLYALNTFGAVLGTYAAGFHLIPALGLRTTLLLAVILNVGIGALAVVFDRHLFQLGVRPVAPGPESSAPGPENATADVAAADRRQARAIWLAVVGLGLSGAASMIYEVAWTRALSLVIGSSTYAFSTMLVAFLAGLALGSYLFSRLARRLRIDPFLFAVLQLGIGLSALAVTPFFDRMPELFLRAFRLSQSPGFVKALQFTISALAMFLPTLFMGATFPCVIQIASRAMHRIGYDVGRIYFINTGGAIAGTVVAGFLLIPTWGLQATLKLAVSMNLSLALALFVVSREGFWRKGIAASAPLVALVLLYVSPPWDARAMASGVAIYGRNYFGVLGRADFREAMVSATRLLFYEDGISATVTVHRGGDQVFLRINGKTDASSGRDMHTQLVLGHLPLLLHPDPKRVLVIGLGSGVTAGAVAGHPVEAVDVIEIEPAVARASALFARENRDVLKDPRVRLAVADGRNYLLASGRQYDVIITEPSNPWIRGMGNLFSLEFYRLAATRLAPQGIMSQWIHGYGLFPEDLKMVVKTFRSVFPHAAIWNTIPGDYLLIGSKDPLVLDYAQLQSRHSTIPGLREDMARLGFRSPLAMLADFVLGEEDTARYARDAWLNTDDLPLLEFSAPESMYAETVGLNVRVMRGFKAREFPPIAGLPERIFRSPEFRRDLGRAFLDKGMPDEALIQFNEALRLDPRDPDSLLQRGGLHLRSASVLLAEADFNAALRGDPGKVEVHEALGHLYKTQRMWDRAEAHLRKALVLRPKDPRRLAQLADLYRDGQQFSKAIPHYLAAVGIAPRDPSLWAGLGLSYQGTGRYEEAVRAFRRALAGNPDEAFWHHQLGRAYLGSKRFEEAAAAFSTAALKAPLRAEPHLELGRIYQVQNDRKKALQAFRRALRLDPMNIAAMQAVEELLASRDEPSS